MSALKHPKFSKECVYCNYWLGNAGLEFLSPDAGYKFNAGAQGKCAQKGSITPALATCPQYEPSMEAKRLL